MANRKLNGIILGKDAYGYYLLEDIYGKAKEEGLI